MFDYDEVYRSTLEYFDGDELATSAWIKKYCLRDKQGALYELNPDDMHRRLAKEFARVEAKFGGSRALSEDQIYLYLKDFQYICPQGSPMMGIGNNFVNVSLSNCVVVEGPEDNMSSILEVGKKLANLYKRRCGVGTDISKLRPEGTPVNNSAITSTGAWSFADFYSYITRMVGQNSRRGALMLTMDVRHPDIENFVTMKHDLTKVTGANISVKLNNEFMQAVENERDFKLQWPVDSENPKVVRMVAARKLWDLMLTSATKTAEPGLMMWDNILEYLPANEYADVGFKTVTTNPCGEVPLSGDPPDSCRLITNNLKNLVEDPFTSKARFNFAKWKEIVSVSMRLSDDLVELELEKLQKIIDSVDDQSEKELFEGMKWSCENGRRTGLGTHGLADALACLRLRYDSTDALQVVDNIYKILRDEAYKESAKLAVERGPFPVFDWNKEKENSFIKKLPKDILKLHCETGRRNISILTNAPTGTCSIMSQTSSGIEPVFRNSYIRRKKVNIGEMNAGENIDFVDDLGDKWQEFEVFHHNVDSWLRLQNYEVPKNVGATPVLPEYFITSDQIKWERRIELQSVIQRYIDHSISSTINLPKETSIETVGSLYMEAWKKDLKGVTVYVDGSRSGVLLTKNDKKKCFSPIQSTKRPEKLECDIHHMTVKSEQWVVLVGLLEDKPYEVFGGLSEMIEIPKAFGKGNLEKRVRKTVPSLYDLSFGENGNYVKIRDVVKAFENPDYAVMTRLVSLGLRHGAAINYIVDQLKKDKDSDMFSFSKCLARVMKKYITNGTKVSTSDKYCKSCMTDGLVYQDGCVVCTNCGFSKCD